MRHCRRFGVILEGQKDGISLGDDVLTLSTFFLSTGKQEQYESIFVTYM